MSYAHDMGHDCEPGYDDPFWDNEDDVMEVFGKTCNRCGEGKLHWERELDYKNEKEVWRLYNMEDELHVCKIKQEVKS